MLLYKFSKFKLLSNFAVVIFFFFLSASFIYQLSRLSFENKMEYFLAYFILLGGLFMLFYLYAYMRALPMFFYSILIQDSSLIYKKADTVVHKFNLSDIESISQKQASQVFILHLKNKERFLLPFEIDENIINDFLHILSNNYHPNINYANHKIKAKKQKGLSIFLVLLFFPFLVIPVLLTPYMLLLYLFGFLFTFMIQPSYLQISDSKLEIINKSKTIILKKQDVRNITLHYGYIINAGIFYKCILSVSNEETHTLSNYEISDIDLFCLLNHWHKI